MIRWFSPNIMCQHSIMFQNTSLALRISSINFSFVISLKKVDWLSGKRKTNFGQQVIELSQSTAVHIFHTSLLGFCKISTGRISRILVN